MTGWDWILVGLMTTAAGGFYLWGRYHEKKRWQWNIYNVPKPSEPPKKYEGLESMLTEWLGDIIKDPKFTRDVLLDHLIHHIEEGRKEGISESWMASMTNLLELVARRAGLLYEPSVQKRIERLYQHWQKDPVNMTPPPQLKSFDKVVEVSRQVRVADQQGRRYVAGEPS